MNINLLKHYILHFFKAKRKGHGIHSPFAYQLCEEVFYNPCAFYEFESLDVLRQDLLEDNRVLNIDDYGAGSTVFRNRQRKISAIAQKGISSKGQSELLFKLSNFLNCQTRVELGTSLGLNTLYLASVNKLGKVYSLEGSSELLEVARTLCKKRQLENCIQFVEGRFDDTFAGVLNSIPQLDLLYVDGNHTYEATLRYFRMALAKTHKNTVFVFDDIYWSTGMTKAWQEICNHPSVTLSIDAFYLGMVFFRPEIKEKQALRFFLQL